MTIVPFSGPGSTDDDAPDTFTEVLLPALMDALLETRDLDAFLAAVPAAMEQAELAHLQPMGIWLARDLWSTTPLPWERFRTRPLPKPERNDPCPCGSGRKYKRCCREVLPSLELLGPELVEGLLVERMNPADRDRARKLASAGLRFDLAVHDMETNHPGRAKKLLLELLSEPSSDPLVEARAMGLLGECYRELGHLRAGIDRLAELTAQREGPVASAGYESMAVLALLEEDPVAALQLLDRALEHDDTNFMAGLCQVEVIGYTGEFAMARRELEHWRPMVEAHGDPEILKAMAAIEDRIDFLESREGSTGLPEDLPEELVEASGEDDEPGEPRIERFARGPDAESAWREVVEPALARPLAEPRFEPGPPGPEGEPSLFLSFAVEVEEARHALFELEEAGAPDPEALREWLQRHPAGLQCPDAVQEVIGLLSRTPLLDPLIEYRGRLLEHYLAPVPDETVVLPWGWLENRPLLRLLFSAGLEAEIRAEPETARRAYERLLSLDPEDAQGARPQLVNLLLREGYDEEALSWIGGDDEPAIFPELAFGAVLAHVRLGRVRDAEAAFRDAHEQLPKVLDHLLRERRPPNDLRPGVVRLGGEDQAWYYGDDMRATFHAEPGLIDFMTHIAKRMERGL